MSEFKAKCFRLLSRIRGTGEPIEILKNGQPLAVGVAEEVLQPPAARGPQGRFRSDEVLAVYRASRGCHHTSWRIPLGSVAEKMKLLLNTHA